jgi:hypothetical protein
MISFPSAIRRFGEVVQETRAAEAPTPTARIACLREVLRRLESGEITAEQAAAELEGRP